MRILESVTTRLSESNAKQTKKKKKVGVSLLMDVKNLGGIRIETRSPEFRQGMCGWFGPRPACETAL